MINEISIKELFEKMKIGVELVDIRDDDSFHAGHIPQAKSINTTEALQQFVQATDRATSIIVYCYHGQSSKACVHYLQGQGFTNVFNLADGYASYGD